MATPADHLDQVLAHIASILASFRAAPGGFSVSVTTDKEGMRFSWRGDGAKIPRPFLAGGRPFSDLEVRILGSLRHDTVTKSDDVAVTLSAPVGDVRALLRNLAAPEVGMVVLSQGHGARLARPVEEIGIDLSARAPDVTEV